MKAAIGILSVSLAVSLLFNLMALARFRDSASTPSAGPSTSRTARPDPDGEAPPRSYAPIPVPQVREAPLVVPAATAPRGTAPVTVPSVIRADPKVQEVLDAQDAFSAFWKDLDRVVKARSRFDEAKYSQTVITATADYLELPESSRGPFFQAAQTAASNAALVRKEYEDSRKALPQRDKANPASYTAYQQQKDAIDVRYQNQMKALTEGLKQSLDLNRPRHAEFASNAEKWIRNLAPRPTTP